MTEAEPSVVALLLGTVMLRPYVFIFLAVYLVANTLYFGLKQTLSFTVVGYFLVFLAEYSSTRIGVPFGFYYYIDTTRQQELWISNVPFMDSLSFTFLASAFFFGERSNRLEVGGIVLIVAGILILLLAR